MAWAVAGLDSGSVDRAGHDYRRGRGSGLRHACRRLRDAPGRDGHRAMAGLVCYVSVVVVKTKFGYDDSLDAFGVHGIGGIWGTLCVGLWASEAINPPAPTVSSTVTRPSFSSRAEPWRSARSTRSRCRGRC